MAKVLAISLAGLQVTSFFLLFFPFGRLFSWLLLLFQGATEYSKPEPKKGKLDNSSLDADEVVKIKKEEENSKSKDDAERKKQEKLQKIAEKKLVFMLICFVVYAVFIWFTQSYSNNINC